MYTEQQNTLPLGKVSFSFKNVKDCKIHIYASLDRKLQYSLFLGDTPVKASLLEVNLPEEMQTICRKDNAFEKVKRALDTNKEIKVNKITSWDVTIEELHKLGLVNQSQIDTLEVLQTEGWKFVKMGANKSIDLQKGHLTRFIREDGVYR